MDRIAVLLGPTNEPVLFGSEVVSAPMPLPSLQRTAHVSGNQIDVLHCPFCGSGAIVSRSDGSIECSFCNSAFTVTVSPVYPAFPMSVNGQPYPWPGRPDGGVDPSMMGDPNAAAGDGFGGQLIPGGAGDAPDDGGDGDGNPFAEGGDDAADDEGAAASDSDGDDGSSDEAEVGGKKKPPFGKKKSARDPVWYWEHRRTFRTANGAELPEREYIRHLAIATAHDPNAMAAVIREERRA